jgi:hypothetical protein
MRIIKYLMAGTLVLAVVAALLFSCSLLKRHPIDFATAKITDIQSLSDTSVVVTIAVSRNSTAYACHLDVLVGTEAGLPAWKKYAVSGKCDLDPRYDVTVPGLKKGTPYFFQLYSGGTYDIGGPNEIAYSKIGAEHTYTIP